MALGSRLGLRCMALPTHRELGMRPLHKIVLSLLCFLLSPILQNMQHKYYHSHTFPKGWNKWIPGPSEAIIPSIYKGERLIVTRPGSMNSTVSTQGSYTGDITTFPLRFLPKWWSISLKSIYSHGASGPSILTSAEEQTVHGHIAAQKTISRAQFYNAITNINPDKWHTSAQYLQILLINSTHRRGIAWLF